MNSSKKMEVIKIYIPNVKTYQEEGHKSQETNIKKQNSLVPKKKKKEIKIV